MPYTMRMAEIRTVTTLTSKRRELESAIAGYERALAQARSDLAHVIACIALFEKAAPSEPPSYADLHRLFKRGEMAKIAKAALAKDGPLDTRQLAQRVMASKGFDPSDAVLAKAITFRLVQALRLQHLRGSVGDAGRRKGVRVWKLC